MKPTKNYNMNLHTALSSVSRPSGTCLWLLPVVVSCSLALVSPGCASMTPHPEKHAERYAELTNLKKYYVTYAKPEDKQNERHQKTLKVVEEALVGRGHSAASGDATAMPADTECKVVVDDHWFWDMGWYLLKLNITLADAKNGTPLGSGWVKRAHPSVRREPPFMANELLDDISHAQITAKSP